jgi:hypothetical protein
LRRATQINWPDLQFDDVLNSLSKLPNNFSKELKSQKQNSRINLEKKPLK